MLAESKQILAVLEAGEYEGANGRPVAIAQAQARAVAGTRLYTPEALAGLVARPPDTAQRGSPRVEIVDATTQIAAEILARDGAVGLLNFASARNPGGGFLGGARAQEEELCRCSGLYPTLLEQRDYYEVNRARRSLLYTDHVIFSPEVPFLRVSAREPWLPSPFLASVITAPAPNAGAIRDRRPHEAPRIRETFERRWANVLAVAEDTELRRLVLGAWGCGAFRNDPHVVARTARDALESPRFRGAFDLVVFAIPDHGHSARNLAAFREIFTDGR